MGDDKKKEKKSKKKSEKTASESEAEAPPAESHSEPKRATRGTSNVFALFKQAQIQEFKEAFQMMDCDRDGFISKDDLAGIYQQTGRDADAKTLDAMLAESPGQLNFTHFLNLFGEKLHGTDPERTLMDAFKMFDPEEKGKLKEDYFKMLMTEVGDLFSKDELKQTMKEAPIEGGMLDYVKFVQLIKRGKEEEAG